MTMPTERARAAIRTEQFLYDLINPEKTPNVPEEVRKQAGSLLRHYPRPLEIEEAADKAPDVFEVDKDLKAEVRERTDSFYESIRSKPKD